MPSINRIRVNNVKYNFGTQMYDDFNMRLYGKNTLYDLANGGGKSVLMLLLMQCLIPNSTLDEKQPIEKLFRENCGNTTIHSLVEWKLDPCDIQDGYRYMTTGFTARKSKDRSDEESGGAAETRREDGVASIDYFNYCIFYREYNKNDIVNLPLVNGNERVTYQAFRNYLSDLKKRDKNIIVYIFDRKGEYQRFISQYGLYESQWEIVRGINKTEGHVRTFFETNYRTTRKVIEDLLIEEIIDKAYLMKVEKEKSEEAGKESAAGLLFSIREQLKELAEKKKDINSYDHEIDLIELFRDRIQSFLQSFCEEDELAAKLAGIYVTGEAIEKRAEEQVREIENTLEQGNEEIERTKAKIETLKISGEKLRARKKEKEIQGKEVSAKYLEKLLQELEKEYKSKKAESYYAEYLEEKEKLDILKAESSAEDVGEEAFYQAIRNLFLWYLFEAGELRKEKIRCREEKEQAEETLRIIAAKLEEAGVGLAVAESCIQFEENAKADITSKLVKLQEGLSEVSFELPEQQLAKKKDRLDHEERQLIFKKEDIRRTKQDIETLEKEELEIRQEKLVLESEIQHALDLEQDYEQSKERLEKIVSIYAPGKTTIEVSSIIKQKIERDIIRLSELEQLIGAAEKREQSLKDGRRIECMPDIQSVMDYIQTRHNATAMFGMDYIAAIDEERKEKLLTLHPELPYCVIADHYEELLQDENLMTAGGGNVPVRIIDREFLEEEDTVESEHSFTVGHDRNYFTSPEILERLTFEAKEKAKAYRDEKKYLLLVRQTEEEDLQFILLHGSKDKLEGKERRFEKEAELNEAEIRRLKKVERIEQTKQKLDELEAEKKALEERIQGILQDLSLLSDMLLEQGKLEEQEKALSKAREDRKRFVSVLEENRPGKQRLEAKVQELADTELALRSKEDRLTENWNEKYAPFLDGKVEAECRNYEGVPDQTKPEVVAVVSQYLSENRGKLQGQEERRMLIRTLEKNLERLAGLMEDLGVSREELQEMLGSQERQVVAPSEESLKKLRRETEAAAEKLEKEKQAISVLREEWVRLSGSIDYAIRNMEAAYGQFHEIVLSEEDLEREMKAQLQHQKELYSVKQDGERSLEKARKQRDNAKGMFRDAARIIERKGIDTSKAEVLSEEETRDILDEFEELLFRFDQLEKMIEKNRTQLFKIQGQTYESLLSLGAASLAVAVRDDAKIPSTLEEANALIQNLNSMVELLKLEKERVEQGIQDMEKLKESFVDSCLERCLDVRTELDKLPKLSQIMIDGEKVPMIKLSIPYVNQELMSRRMAEYIDHIVEEADGLGTEAERKKYMQTELQVKRLFSVIVTDMNKIRLMLYKRERIKEQSRYLRYEEAVGSTGQSQGIYIQFLVSVINYISGMNSVNAGDARSKTIFIDNPFGAAKDIYIWEPIFKLLATNQVQLIVPSRGATPEITGRFDVNYVLGQKMYGSKALTVVVNYNSNTEGEELEYRDLEYSQETFDFI